MDKSARTPLSSTVFQTTPQLQYWIKGDPWYVVVLTVEGGFMSLSPHKAVETDGKESIPVSLTLVRIDEYCLGSPQHLKS